MREPIKRISKEFAAQAAQIISNFCDQTNMEVGCAHCMFWSTEREGCLFYGDFPERWLDWKAENGIEVVNG